MRDAAPRGIATAWPIAFGGRFAILAGGATALPLDLPTRWIFRLWQDACGSSMLVGAARYADYVLAEKPELGEFAE